MHYGIIVYKSWSIAMYKEVICTVTKSISVTQKRTCMFSHLELCHLHVLRVRMADDRLRDYSLAAMYLFIAV